MTVMVMVLALMSKVLGFFRQTLIAIYYGADAYTDAFFFAESIPSYCISFFSSALGTALLPMYLSAKIRGGKKRGYQFASSVIVMGISVSCLLSLISLPIMPYVVKMAAPGFSLEQRELAISLSKIALSASLISVGCTLYTALLNANKGFIEGGVAALFFNISIISLMVIIGRGHSVYELMWIFFIGHVSQFLLVFFFMRKYFSFSLDKENFLGDNKSVLVFALPIIISNMISSLGGVVSNALASLLEDGTLSALSYSSSLNAIVSSIFISSLATVIFPNLTLHGESDDKTAFLKELNGNTLFMMLFLFPVSVFFFVESRDIISLIFGWGGLSEKAISITSSALMGYAWMYPFQGIQNTFSTAFYALKDSKKPLICSLITLFINAAVSILLSSLLGVMGLTLGTTISTLVSSLLYSVFMKHKIREGRFFFLEKSLYKIIGATAVMFCVSYLLVKLSAGFSLIVRFIIVGTSGLSSYIVFLYLTKCKELETLTALILSFLKRKIKEK